MEKKQVTTVIGEVNPLDIVRKLVKSPLRSEIVSVEPPKEPEKKKEKKEDHILLPTVGSFLEETSGFVRHNGDDNTKTCIKCNGSGQLLICSECPMAVHQSCWEYEDIFDNMGNFCCPYCSLISLEAECKRSKEKLISQEKVLSTLYNINVAGVPGCQRQADASIVCREEEAIDHAFHTSTGELTHHVSHQENMESQQKTEASFANRGDERFFPGTCASGANAADDEEESFEKSKSEVSDDEDEDDSGEEVEDNRS